MKAFSTIITLIFIATASYAETFTVERVIDGDTIKLTNGEEVQLIGIKAPEDEQMAQEAMEFLKSILKEGQEIQLEFDVQERDNYGRLLAYVFYHDPKGWWHRAMIDKNGKVLVLVNALMIMEGYATPTTNPSNVKYSDLFKELHEEASASTPEDYSPVEIPDPSTPGYMKVLNYLSNLFED